MTRALVTGAGGFVGSNLAGRLLRDGHEVHLLLRPGRDSWRVTELAPHAVLHRAELEDAAAVAAVVAAARPEWVFHLAVYGAYSDQADWPRMVRTNLLGTSNLVEACLRSGFDALVNTGSSSEYGLKDHAPAEDEPLDPASHYAVSKAAATHFCRHTARSRGVQMPTLRLYSVYGPYEEPRRLMPTLVVHGREGRLPPLVSPRVARDFVHADDVVEAYLLAARTRLGDPGAVFNIGSGTQTTILELVELARRLFEITDPPVWSSMPDRSWDTERWVSDPGKAARELGWVPRESLEQGLPALAGWVGADPGRLERYRRESGPRP